MEDHCNSPHCYLNHPFRGKKKQIVEHPTSNCPKYLRWLCLFRLIKPVNNPNYNPTGMTGMTPTGNLPFGYSFKLLSLVASMHQPLLFDKLLRLLEDYTSWLLRRWRGLWKELLRLCLVRWLIIMWGGVWWRSATILEFFYSHL